MRTIAILLTLLSFKIQAAVPETAPKIAPAPTPVSAPPAAKPMTTQILASKLKELTEKNPRQSADAVIFDLPVTSNKKVSKWINYYQTRGRKWFREWLERSTKYMPYLTAELKAAGLPTDLAYMVMIESGFSFHATSFAEAVGPWQFIAPTGARYGLERNWWLDERRDLKKSTRAAIRYLKDLRDEFGSWYLVAASYNMGENGLRNRINKAGTKDYWTLVHKGVLPVETQEYVPKILAAMLISKAPNLYGFRDVERLDAYDCDVMSVPGGTDINKIADAVGVTRKSLKDLNAELILGYIPRQVESHQIRVPKGAARLVADYVRREKTKSW